MAAPEYRGDDQTVGYCPACSRPLSNISVEGNGFCEEHGTVAANWEKGLRTFELSAWVTVEANNSDEALAIAREIEATHTASIVTLHIDDGEPIDTTEE